MLYGKLPIGVSKMTSEKCREHLRKLILKYSLPRQENDQKSADLAPAPLAVMPNSNALQVCESDQRQKDTTTINPYDVKARKPYFVKMVVSLPKTKTAFNGKMQENFKESIKNALHANSTGTLRRQSLSSGKIQLVFSDINLEIIESQKKIQVEVTISARVDADSLVFHSFVL